MESQKSHNNNKNEIKKAIQLISKLEGKKLTIEVKRLIKLLSNLTKDKIIDIKFKEPIVELLFGGLLKIPDKKRELYKQCLSLFLKVTHPKVQEAIRKKDELCELMFINNEFELFQKKSKIEKYTEIKNYTQNFSVIENVSLKTFKIICHSTFDYYVELTTNKSVFQEEIFQTISQFIKFIKTKVIQKKDKKFNQKYVDLLYMSYPLLDLLVIQSILFISEDKERNRLIIQSVNEIVSLLLSLSKSLKIQILSEELIQKIISINFLYFSYYSFIEKTSNQEIINTFLFNINDNEEGIDNYLTNNLLNFLYYYFELFESKGMEEPFYNLFSFNYTYYLFFFGCSLEKEQEISLMIKEQLNIAFCVNQKYNVFKGVISYFYYCLTKNEDNSLSIEKSDYSILQLLHKIITNEYFNKINSDNTIHILIFKIVQILFQRIEPFSTNELYEIKEIIKKGLIQNEKVIKEQKINEILSELVDICDNKKWKDFYSDILIQLLLICYKKKIKTKKEYKIEELVLQNQINFEEVFLDYLDCIFQYKTDKNNEDYFTQILTKVKEANTFERKEINEEDSLLFRKVMMNSLISIKKKEIANDYQFLFNVYFIQSPKDKLLGIDSLKTISNKMNLYFVYQKQIINREWIKNSFMRKKMDKIFKTISQCGEKNDEPKIKNLVDLLEEMILQFSNEELNRNLFSLLFILYKNNKSKQIGEEITRVINAIIINTRDNNNIIELQNLLDELYKEAYYNNINYFCSHLFFGRNQQIFYKEENDKVYCPLNLFSIQKEGSAYLNITNIVNNIVKLITPSNISHEIVDETNTEDLVKEQNATSEPLTNTQQNKRVEEDLKQTIQQLKIEKEKKKKVYVRCIKRILQQCSNIENCTVNACADLFLLKLSYTEKEFDLNFLKIVGFFNYRLRFSKDYYNNIDNKKEKYQTKELLLDSLVSELKASQKKNYYIFFLQSIIDDINKNNEKSIKEGSRLYINIIDIIKQCKDIASVFGYEDNAFLLLTILYQMKEIMSLCGDDIIKDIILILLTIGWRSQTLFEEVLKHFHFKDRLEKAYETGFTVKQYQNDFINLFCDILLCYYISKVSNSFKNSLYSLILKYVTLSFQKTSSKPKPINLELDKKNNMRKEIFLEMLYLSSVEYSKSIKGIKDFKEITIYEREKEIMLMNSYQNNKMKIRLISSTSDITYIISSQKQGKNQNKMNSLDKIKNSLNNKLLINNSQSNEKKCKESTSYIFKSFIESFKEKTLTQEDFSHYTIPHYNYIESLLKCPITYTYDVNIIYFDISHKSSRTLAKYIESQIIYQKIPRVFSLFLSRLGTFEGTSNNVIVYKDEFFTLRFHLLNLSKTKIPQNRINIFLIDAFNYKVKKVLAAFSQTLIAFFITPLSNSTIYIQRKMLTSNNLYISLQNNFLKSYIINVEMKSGIQYLIKHLIVSSKFLVDNSTNCPNPFIERYEIINKIYTAPILNHTKTDEKEGTSIKKQK